MSMLILLPGIVFALLVVLLRRAWPWQTNAAAWRDALALACVVFGWLLLGLTEILGVVRALTPVGVALGWGGVLLTLLVGTWRSSRKAGAASKGEPGLKSWPLPNTFSGVDWIILASLVAVLGLVAVTAFVAPPQEADVLTYHLSRVAHWIQNRSVGHYATADARQLWTPPWPDYAALHLYLLGGSDRFVGFVQWSALAVTLVVVSRLAGLAGAGPRGQLFAALYAGTVPFLVAQASSPLSDVVVVLWVVVSALLAWRAARPEAGWPDTIALGGAIGLGFFTKASYVLYAIPLATWWVASILRRVGARAAIERALVVLFVILAGGALMWVRNWVSFGWPLGPREYLDLHSNEILGIGPTVSNLIRNISLQVTLPFDRWNEALDKAVRGLHAILALNPEDPRFSFHSFRLGWLWPGDNSAPAHFGLACLVIVILLARPRTAPHRRLWPFVLSAVVGLVLFSAVFQWQDSSRFHMSFYGLMAPAVGVWLGSARRSNGATAVGVVLLLVVLPVLLFDRWRPLIRLPPYAPNPSILTRPRLDMYFRAIGDQEAGYRAGGQDVLESGCRDVGLRIDSGDREYLWWVVLNPFRNGLRLEHLLVHPGLERLRDPSFEPCALICTVCDEASTPIDGFAGRDEGGGVWVYFPEDETP